MKDEKENFEVKKTFGIDVLLKITKSNINGIDIKETDGKCISNLSPREMDKAVTQTMADFDISLKIGK